MSIVKCILQTYTLRLELNFDQIIGFDWDEGNTRKNEEKHGVFQAEIEQIFFNTPLLLSADERHSQREQRHHAFGRTDSDRRLHVTFTIRQDGRLIRPISARAMNKKEMTLMGRPLKKIPEFSSEAAERAFWESPENDSTEYVDWSKAKMVSFPNLRRSTRTISLRLPEELLAAIRREANRLDVPYQSLMKLWLAERASKGSQEAGAPRRH